MPFAPAAWESIDVLFGQPSNQSDPPCVILNADEYRRRTAEPAFCDVFGGEDRHVRDGRGSDIVIDLISDTVSRPSEGMREAMARAEVGDEQRGEDPTVTRLCDKVAALLGYEHAVFLPSGTMCNQIAVGVHCRPGDQVFAADDAHLVYPEGGAIAKSTGVAMAHIPSRRGIFSRADLASRIRPPKANAQRPCLVTVEQTTNRGGGAVWPLETIDEVAAVAKEEGLLLHMDGARILNASVAADTAPAEFTRHVDSCWLDLTKGLGCPVGAVLAGSSAFIDNAWRWKYQLGGAMRQAGILAAAGLYALDRFKAQMQSDHEHARQLAEYVHQVPGFSCPPSHVETNIVLLTLEPPIRVDAARFCEMLQAGGVRAGPVGRDEIRAVTHLDVTRSDIETAGDVIADVARKARG